MSAKRSRTGVGDTELKAQRAANKRRATDKPTNSGGGNRRQEILDIAADLFATRGIASTTVRDIGQAAGMLSGSLYHYFDSKETMIDEIISGPVRELVARDEDIIASSASAAEAIERLLRTIIESVIDHQVIWQIMQNDFAHLSRTDRFSYLADQDRRVTEIWTSALTRGIGEGSVRSDIPADITYRYVRDSVAMMTRWFRKDGAYSKQTITDAWVALAFQGMAVNAPTGS